MEKNIPVKKNTHFNSLNRTESAIYFNSEKETNKNTPPSTIQGITNVIVLSNAIFVITSLKTLKSFWSINNVTHLVGLY